MRTIQSLFHGGIYLPSEKALTLDAPVQAIADPQFIFIPMRQHKGAPAVPCVQPGELVLQGQPIGRADGEESVAAHSPVSGKVCAIDDIRLPDGTHSLAAVIESDRRNEAVEHINVPHDPAEVSEANFAERFAGWGLVQMSCRGMPLHRRLQIARDNQVHTIVVNAMESEPYLTADHRLTVEQTLLVALGLAHLCRLIGADRGIVAVDHRRREEAELLDRLLVEHGEALGLTLGAECLDHLYPQGHELMLLKTLFDEEVPVRLDDGAGGLASDRAGVCVLGVGTVAAAADAMLFNRPLTHRVVTVSGEAVRKPGNFLAPVGTRVFDLLALCDVESEYDRLVVGGPMTGVAQPDDQSVLTKQTSGLVLFGTALVHQPGPCIRCGWCVEDCPVGINPALLADLAESGQWRRGSRFHAETCIECNICSYVCPSRLPVMERICKLKRALEREEDDGASGRVGEGATRRT
ncbi:MAG: RnfABCDGE type electron transport complex subunit C [Phycisphaerae bacterium]|nr:RnfABCDGE type electron transport complex subunit C [Phycisphaerae bacterium]